MKKVLTTLCALFITFGALYAQPGSPGRGGEHRGPEGHERLEAVKVAFITKKLNLTAEEAQEFWPIHNEMTAELKKVWDARRELMPNPREAENDLDDQSEEEILRIMNKMMELEQDELDIRVKYHEKFLEVLPAKKVALLYRAEEQFKRELVRHMRNEHRRPQGED